MSGIKRTRSSPLFYTCKFEETILVPAFFQLGSGFRQAGAVLTFTCSFEIPLWLWGFIK